MSRTSIITRLKTIHDLGSLILGLKQDEVSSTINWSSTRVVLCWIAVQTTVDLRPVYVVNVVE